MRTPLLLSLPLLAACASAAQRSPAAESSPTVSGAIQFDGQFRPIQQTDGRLGMNVQQRIYGEVRLLFRESSGRTTVSLTLNTNTNASDVLAWAVVPGRCGSGAVPLLPAAQFPALEMANNGRGDLSAVIPIVMPRGSYHVNVYRGGETLSNVIACANLTPS